MDCRSIASRPSLGTDTFAHSPSGTPRGLLPTQTIATSAALARLTASPSSLLVAQLTATPGPALLLIPSRGVTRYGGVPLYQSNSTSFARGPRRAMDLSRFRSR